MTASPAGEWVLRLEELRQQIEAAEHTSGSIADYLDRGNPGEQERQEARAVMERHFDLARDYKRQLEELVTSTRRDAPQALEIWIDAHQSACREILSENNSQDDDQEIRLRLAQQALENWEKLRQGGAPYFHISGYFLSDYKDKLNI